MAGSGELARYPRPSVAVDVALFTLTDAGLGVVLVRRDRDPLRGAWALPGTILRIDETLDGAAVRVLEQKAGLSGYYLDQLGAFGDLDRDPRGRVISVAYVALAGSSRPGPWQHRGDGGGRSADGAHVAHAGRARGSRPPSTTAP